ALFFGGLNQESILENSTIFGNQVNLTSSENARGGGIRLEGDRSFVIKNALVYGNVLGDTVNPESDLNSANITQLTLINSISGFLNGLGTDDVFDSSNTSADLGTSNLRFDEQLGFVIYDIPPTGDDSPIDFGDDGHDAGAWDSMHVLSINSATIDDQTFSVFFNKANKTLKVFSSHNSDMLISLYAINGAEVYAKRKIKKTDLVPLQALNAGVYIIRAVINEKTYTKKFILY
ncbi:MAG: T9SS type A sorting domain-containing protein, partial [Ulvibacter sp.]|nr:T9SS type A sorting domain-containing protein [Ulvibacter sp.]